ncbi:MAG: hypothetical protein Q9193_001391 [Seirophora villosa]
MANYVRSNTIFIVKPLNNDAVKSLKSIDNGQAFDFHDGLEEFGGRMEHQSHLGLHSTSSLPTASGTELHVHFNSGLRNASRGFVFGTDKRFCDVHLSDPSVDGQWPRISGQHFRISFDLDTRSLELHNESREGTRVLTPSHASRPKLLGQRGKHVINALEYTEIIAGRLKFEIVIPLRRACYRQYHSLGDYFELAIATTFGRYKNLFISMTQATEFSMTSEEAYSDRLLKAFLEAEHIVHAVGLLYDSQYPEFGSEILATEFFELGSLADLKDVSAEEMGITLSQSLQALAFLHDDKKMKHGNIKPTNILVQSRAPALFVKLSDFLLTPQYVYLEKKSFYGRGPYTAPDMFFSWAGPTASDIWALGVVGYEMIYYPRPFEDCVDDDWPTVVNAAVNNDTSKAPSAQLLLRRMLKMEATERPSAKQCLLDPWLQSLSSPSSTEPPSKLLCHPDQEAIRALPATEPSFPGQVPMNPSTGQLATPCRSVKEEVTKARTSKTVQAGSNRRQKDLDSPVAQGTRSAIAKDMSKVVTTGMPSDWQVFTTTHAKAYDQAITSSGGRVSRALPTPEEYEEVQKGNQEMQISKKRCTADDIQQRSRLGDCSHEDVHKGEHR